MSEDWEAVAAEVAEAVASVDDENTPLNAKIIRRGSKSGGTESQPTFDDPASHPCNATYEGWKTTEIDGKLIRQGDRKVMIAAYGLEITPEIGDKFLASGDSTPLTVVEPLIVLAPAGVPISYTLNVRG